MRVITAILYIDEHTDPPTAGLSVEIDGQPVTAAENVNPSAWVATIDNLAATLGTDLRAEMNPTVQDIIARLQALVQHGQQTLDARQAALTDWQAAAAS